MFKKSFLVSLLIVCTSIAPLPAQAVATYDTAAGSGIWASSASSSTSWTQGSDPNGAYMRFEVSTTASHTVDVEISATQGGTTVDFSNGACAATINLSGGASLVLTTHQRSSTSITCRFVASSWAQGMGYTFPLRVDTTDPVNLSNGYGELRVSFGNTSNNNQNQNQNPNNQSSAGSSNSTAKKYAGPELVTSPANEVKPGSTNKLAGKKLDTITSITVDGKAASFKANSDKELELTLPNDLAPGQYDLVIMSSHGKLVQMGAITIKAPTQAANFSLKGSGSKVDAYMLTELSNIGSMFNSDYKKITCVVNAADAATAQAVADKVCKTLKAGELRSATTKSVAKSTFKGEGYWVRVYLAG